MEKKIRKTIRTPLAKSKVRGKKPGIKISAIAKKPKAKVEQVPRILGLDKLNVPRGAHKAKKLLGRGSSSGHGKTSTRGSKGQTSRAGRHFYLGFEGGQTPLIRRMPKRGFTSKFKKDYQIVNLSDLNRIKENMITVELLKEKGLIKGKNLLVKILGDGEIKNAVTIQVHAASKQAADKIAKSGGKLELINA